MSHSTLLGSCWNPIKTPGNSLNSTNNMVHFLLINDFFIFIVSWNIVIFFLIVGLYHLSANESGS